MLVLSPHPYSIDGSNPAHTGQRLRAALEACATSDTVSLELHSAIFEYMRFVKARGLLPDHAVSIVASSLAQARTQFKNRVVRLCFAEFHAA